MVSVQDTDLMFRVTSIGALMRVQDVMNFEVARKMSDLYCMALKRSSRGTVAKLVAESLIAYGMTSSLP